MGFEACTSKRCFNKRGVQDFLIRDVANRTGTETYGLGELTKTVLYYETRRTQVHGGVQDYLEPSEESVHDTQVRQVREVDYQIQESSAK